MNQAPAPKRAAAPAPSSRADGVLGLGLANALALIASALAASAYGRWLAPADFAHWAVALALARALLLLLDGGLKTALVRRAAWPGRAALARLRRISAGAAFGLVAATAAVVGWCWATRRLAPAAAWLDLVYVGAYLLPYPPLLLALARLERAQRFRAIGRAEAFSVLAEFALPALLLAGGIGPWWLAFLVSVVAARCLRSLWIVLAARTLPAEAAAEAGDGAGGVLREGSGVQAIAALAMARDQMHLWLVAPWFGAAWGGQYAFAFTACALATQAFVQTASRTVLPALLVKPRAQRWPLVRERIRVLALAVLPPLALLPAWLARADLQFWDGRWAVAATLVPWIALRMVCGVAMTMVGAWLLVECTPWSAARRHALWTALEIACAAVALACFGARGLAIGAAFSAWPGLLLFMRGADPDLDARHGVAELARALLGAPAPWLALALACWVALEPAALLPATLLLPLGWLVRPSLLRRLGAAVVRA